MKPLPICDTNYKRTHSRSVELLLRGKREGNICGHELEAGVEEKTAHGPPCIQVSHGRAVGGLTEMNIPCPTLGTRPGVANGIHEARQSPAAAESSGGHWPLQASDEERT